MYVYVACVLRRVCIERERERERVYLLVYIAMTSAGRLITLPVASVVAFEVFDVNGDNFIDRSEFILVLKATNKRHMTTEQLTQIADATIARWDTQGHGKLDYESFKGLISASSSTLSL